MGYQVFDTQPSEHAHNIRDGEKLNGLHIIANPTVAITVDQQNNRLFGGVREKERHTTPPEIGMENRYNRFDRVR